MSKPVNKTVIGMFVVGAVALILVAILLLGSGKFLKHRPKYVTYFEGSVKGLTVGSPVVFRGVKVGTVTEIRMRFDPKNFEMQIPVYVELGEGNLEIVGAEESQRGQIFNRQEQEHELIKRGFRARLATQSFVTGQLMVTLDFFPDTPVKLVGAEPRYTEIPSIPTPLQELQHRLETIPLEETFNKLQNVADGIDKLVNSPEIKRILKSTEQGINNATVLIHEVSEQITPLAIDIREALDEITKLGTETRNEFRILAQSFTKTSDEAGLALKKVEGSFSNIENLTGEGSTLTYTLANTLRELELTARSFRILTENIDQQPQSVVFGKKKMGKE
jgi:paraquat-inducible protein B